MIPGAVKAIIADDEAPLRAYLKTLLADVWPELEICAEAGNGIEAVRLISAHRPQVAFLDIRMPGLSGLQAAEEIAHGCRVVFVTAYDAYAVAAFEKQAADYLLKPVTRERLARTAARLKSQMTDASAPPPQTLQVLQELIAAIAAPQAPAFLQWLRVQHGDGIQLIPVQDVIYFQASDKYTLVKTRDREALIRKSIRELSTELDPQRFRQIHRGTIVNLSCIAKVSHSLTGRGVIRLKDRSETLTVSRSNFHLFKQM
ncbi:MAG: DNA-binding response regulator [Desulfobacteraceae bacterium]|nr:MAG: DNA-binding response regulator [Desulfobacteraceae bacterium]